MRLSTLIFAALFGSIPALDPTQKSTNENNQQRSPADNSPSSTKPQADQPRTNSQSANADSGPESSLQIYVLEETDKELFQLTMLDYRATKNPHSYRIFKKGNFIFDIERLENAVNADGSPAPEYKILLRGDTTYADKFYVKGNYLFIRNAELTDEAKYECEYEALGRPYGEDIYAREVVIVRTPTVSVHYRENLVYYNGESSKTTRKNKVYKVAECKAAFGKPAAELEWVYKGGKEPEGWRQGEPQLINGGGIDYTTTREIFFKVNPDMNGTEIECQVSKHPALALNKDFESRKRKELNIDFPPQNVEIIASNRKELECSARANPEPRFSWKVNGQDYIETDKSTIPWNQTSTIANQTVTCTARNIHGKRSAVSDPSKLIAVYNARMAEIHAAETDNTTLFIIIGVVVVLLIVIVAFLAYHKLGGKGDRGNGAHGHTESTQQGETDVDESAPLKSNMPQIISADLGGKAQIISNNSMQQSQVHMDTMTRQINEFQNLEQDVYNNPTGQDFNTPSQNDNSFVAQPDGPEARPQVEEVVYDDPNESNEHNMYFDDPSTRPK